MAKFSEYFTLEELTRSETASRLGIDNTPTDQHIITNLQHLCTHLLDPIREHLGTPLIVTSGYRSPELNAALPGTAKLSAHMEGRAADVVPMGMGIEEAWHDILDIWESLAGEKIIHEFSRWFHIQTPRADVIPKHQVLYAYKLDGYTTYSFRPEPT